MAHPTLFCHPRTWRGMGSIRTRPPQTRTHQTDPHVPKLWIVHWFKSRPLRHILHSFATTAHAHGEGWDPSEPAPPNYNPPTVHWFKSRPLRWHILHYFATTAHGEGWDPSEPEPPQTRTHQTDPHMPKLWIVHWFKSRPLRWHILHYFATTAHGEGWNPSEPDPPKLEPTKLTHTCPNYG